MKEFGQGLDQVVSDYLRRHRRGVRITQVDNRERDELKQAVLYDQRLSERPQILFDRCTVSSTLSDHRVVCAFDEEDYITIVTYGIFTPKIDLVPGLYGCGTISGNGGAPMELFHTIVGQFGGLR